MRARRPARAIAAVALTALALPAAAGAHATLQTSIPRWGAVLRTAPAELTLTYDEDVVGRYARVAVIAAGGHDIAGTPTTRGSEVVVPLRPGGRASYTVRWQMVASDDGHVTEGAYTFGVGVKPLPPVPAAGVGVAVAPELLAWLQFLGVVLAGGLLAVRALVWAPEARALGSPGEQESRAALWVAVAGAAVALHAGLAAFLVGAYPIVGGGGFSSFADAEIVPIRLATHVGQAWTVTTFAWLLVLAVLVAAWVTPARRERLMAIAGLLALATAFGISWASHPDSRGTLALVADYVHLLAAALWTGALVGLVILTGVGRRLARPDREALARSCLQRFSRVAVPVVGVLALAGGYLALRELPNASALVDSGYGVTLLVKVGVTVAALAVGAYHHRLAVPRIAAGATVAGVRRSLALEASLLLLALALAATLSQTAPPG